MRTGSALINNFTLYRHALVDKTSFTASTEFGPVSTHLILWKPETAPQKLSITLDSYELIEICNIEIW